MVDLDLDELLDLLEKEVEQKSKTAKKAKFKGQKSVDNFVKEMKVVAGPDRIPNYVIHYTYKKIFKDSTGTPKEKRDYFFRLFNKMFQRVRTGRQKYYLLDAKSFDMSREGLLEAKKFSEEYELIIKKRTGNVKKRKK